MKDPFRSLADIQRELDDMALEITRARFIHFTTPRSWQPALNVFRCGGQFVVCADLAGVDRASIEVRAEPRRLTIRGERAIAEPSCDDPPAVQVLALEIDHGLFERVLELPADIDPQRVTAEHRNGMLWIKLPLRLHG
jgi:HSP20 family protein